MRILMVLVAFSVAASSVHARTRYRTPEVTSGYFEYVSPVPGATMVRPATLIVLRVKAGGNTDQDWTRVITVEGTMSGRHSGMWTVATDNRTLNFHPNTAFVPGEHVSVRLDIPGQPTRSTALTNFSTSTAPAGLDPDYVDECGSDADLPAGPFEATGTPMRSLSTLPAPLPSDFPTINILTSGATAPGYLFASNKGPAPNQPYLMILDNSGSPIFFRKMTKNAQDFKKQEAHNLLTYCYQTADPEFYYVLDNTYTLVDSFQALSGYNADQHDFLLLPSGNALLMIYQRETVDMSVIVPGGDPAASVVGFIMQELDPAKNLIWEWRSWDHFQITDATNMDFTASDIDYVHGNAFYIDTDGNILLSSRHMDEITKINHTTGDIIWRMGGKNNEFALINDTSWYTRQHSVRRTPSGTIILFDNGNNSTPRESRMVEYVVDEVNKTATMVLEFRNTPSTYGGSQGSVQRLPNGNTLIGWGSTNPNITEVDPSGNKLFELTYVPNRVYTYRAFRDEWSAVAAAPTLWAETFPTEVTLYFTKFGDSGVAHYNIYRSPAPGAMTSVGSTTTNAFTMTDVTAGDVFYCRVTAVDLLSVESPFSNEVRVEVPPVPLPVFITRFDAAAGGDAIELSWQISADEDFRGFKVLRTSEDGRRHWISGPELIAAGVERYVDRDVVPGQSYEYALAVVLADGSEMLSQDVKATMEAQSLALHQNHPNPFNPTTVISFVLPAQARVELSIYDPTGGLVRRLADRVMTPGPNEFTWDGRDSNGEAVSSGIYFYQLKTGKQTLTRKMTLLK